jgi:hypothetical protein
MHKIFELFPKLGYFGEKLVFIITTVLRQDAMQFA